MHLVQSLHSGLFVIRVSTAGIIDATKSVFYPRRAYGNRSRELLRLSLSPARDDP